MSFVVMGCFFVSTKKIFYDLLDARASQTSVRTMDVLKDDEGPGYL